MRKFSWKKVNVEVPVPIPGAVRLRQSQAFKLAAALAVGVVAALIIMMTGFGAEYKTSTVMYRAFVGFLFGSFSVFILEQLLDRFGIPMFVARNEELRSVWVSEAYDDDYLYALDEDTEETAEEEGRRKPERKARRNRSRMMQMPRWISCWQRWQPKTARSRRSRSLYLFSQKRGRLNSTLLRQKTCRRRNSEILFIKACY